MEKYERVAHAAGEVYRHLIGFQNTLRELSDNAHLTSLYIDYKGEPTPETLSWKVREIQERAEQVMADMEKWAEELESEED